MAALLLIVLIWLLFRASEMRNRTYY